MSRACSLFLILLWSLPAASLPREGREISFDEAVEIAKKYGSTDSGAFVNGILDHVAKSL